METAMKNAGLVGVTLHHKKMAEVFRRAQEKEEARNNELSTYEDEKETESEDTQPKKARKGGVNIAEFAKKMREKDSKK